MNKNNFLQIEFKLSTYFESLTNFSSAATAEADPFSCANISATFLAFFKRFLLRSTIRTARGSSSGQRDNRSHFFRDPYP